MLISFGYMKIFVGDMEINKTREKNIWRLLGEITLPFSLKIFIVFLM
jgi:hypothetical protein